MQNKIFRRLIFTLLFIALSFNYSFAGISQLQKGVSVYQLDNGIQVLLIEKKSLPMIGINTVVKVGSAYESFATSGMSHMLEHLLFNGTTTMTQKELYDATDRIGGYNNANTGEYYTNFMMVTPVENIVEGMKIQAAMLFDSVLPEEKFKKEKGIVLEEIAKSLASSYEQEERNINSVIFKGHALSLPTLGTYETIKYMDRDDVYKFYKNYYVPNNMIISVIGNFNTKDMLEKIKEIYGKQKPGNVKYPMNTTLATGFNKPENIETGNSVYHRFYGGKNLKMQIFFEITDAPNMEFFELLNSSLASKSDSLKKELNTKFNDSVKDISFYTKEFPVKSFLEVSSVLKNNSNLNEIQDYLLSLLTKVKFNPANETVKSKSIKARTQFLKNTEKPHMFGIYNASLFAEYGIESILAHYSGEGYKLAAEKIRKFGLNGNPVTIIQHPQLNEMRDVVEKKTQPELFVQTNGKPTIIAKENKGSNLLAIHYLVKYKSAYESKYGKDAAKIWHAAFGNRMKSPEVQKESMKFGFSFTVNDNPWIPMDNIYLDPSFGYIRVEALGDDIPAAIDFLNKQMLNFIPTKEEFEKAKSSFMPMMMGRHGNPAKDIFRKELEKVLYEAPKYPENKNIITYENILEFGKYYFTPGNMIISVISSAKPDDVKKYFSYFKKEMLPDAITGSGYKQTFKQITKPYSFEEKGNGEQAYLYFGFQKDVKEDEHPALKALSLLLADKIIFDIREKQGMAYRMSAGVDVKENKAMFYINMATRPENVDKLIPQFPKFFTPRFVKEITKAELEKTVNYYVGRKMMFRRLSSINQAYYLGNSYYFHNDIFYDEKFIEAFKNVTVEQVKNVAEKYLQVKNPVQIIVR
jgi:predicted Zn-dependent peptidase